MFGTAEKTQLPADLIKDGTEASFMQDVIEASKTVPVIVDFWATWCGPCKTLTPMLEAAVTAAKGRVKLVKIDVDKAQGLSAKLQRRNKQCFSANFYYGKCFVLFVIKTFINLVRLLFNAAYCHYFILKFSELSSFKNCKHAK